MSETIEIKVKLPEKTYRALEWYVRQTRYWRDNDHESETISEYLADVAEEWLKMEADDPQDAVDAIKAEMQLLFQ